MDGTDMLHTRMFLDTRNGTDMLQRQHSAGCPSAPCCMFIHADAAQLLLSKVLLMCACKARPACIHNHVLSTKPSQW